MFLIIYIWYYIFSLYLLGEGLPADMKRQLILYLVRQLLLLYSLRFPVFKIFFYLFTFIITENCLMI